MPSRTYRGRVASLTTMVTSLTKIFDDVRQRQTVRRRDARAASSQDESIHRYTTALVIQYSVASSISI